MNDTIVELLSQHGKWDIRQPRGEGEPWHVYPEYADVWCGGEGDTLEDALELALARVRLSRNGASRSEVRALTLAAARELKAGA